MQSEQTKGSAIGTSQERLPWHKPEVQRLVVNLDTAGAPGSNDDFEAGSVFVSDMRVKKDVSGIKDALKGVLSLNGVQYSYDTTKYPQLRLSKKPQIGFLAQELEQVYPQLVKTREDGLKAVNYAHLVPVLVEAIKEQQSMITQLREQVDQLKQKSA